MPKIIDKEEKKRDILNAAMRIFARKGAARTKMADIALEAGIGKGTIYEYFNGKEKLFAALFHHMMGDLEHGFKHELQHATDPVQKLEIFVRVTLSTFLKKYEEHIDIMMDFWAEGIRSNSKDVIKIFHLETMYDEFRKVISGILDEGIASGIFRPIDTQIAASVFIGAFDGLLLQWIMNKNIFDYEKAGQGLLDCFLNGVIQ